VVEVVLAGWGCFGDIEDIRNSIGRYASAEIGVSHTVALCVFKDTWVIIGIINLSE
jgi:hypothetical protein